MRRVIFYNSATLSIISSLIFYLSLGSARLFISVRNCYLSSISLIIWSNIILSSINGSSLIRVSVSSFCSGLRPVKCRSFLRVLFIAYDLVSSSLLYKLFYFISIYELYINLRIYLPKVIQRLLEVLLQDA